MTKILLFENTSEVQLALADEYLEKGDLPSAISAMRTAYEIDNDATIFVNIGDAYLHAGLVGAAFDSYAEAYVNGVRTTQCLFGLSRSAFFLGYDKDSADYFKEMFMQNVTDFADMDTEIDALGDEYTQVTGGGLENKGFSFVKSDAEKSFDEDMVALVRENPEKALPYFENVPESSKLFYEARNNIALIKLMTCCYDESIEECNRILAKKPNDVFALSTLLAAYASIGNKERAQAIARKVDAIAITDEEDARKVALAMCQAELHDYAVKYLEKLHVQKYDRNIMLLTVIAYYNVGDKKHALSLVKAMRKLFPKDNVMLSSVEQRIKDQKEEFLPYSVVMLHGDTLNCINDAREMIGAYQDEEEFDLKELVQKVQDDNNYRLLYWYLTNHAHIYDNDELMILFRLCWSGDDKCMALIRELLTDFSVDGELKSKCVRVLVCSGYEESIYLVLGASIKKIKLVYPEGFEDARDGRGDCLLWAQAYAIAFSEMVLRGVDFGEELKSVAEDVRYRLNAECIAKMRSPFALAAIMFKQTQEYAHATVKELCEIFGISSETLKKYEKILNKDEEI